MKFKITGEAKVTIEGANYAALVPVTAYDSDNTVVDQVELQVTGPLTDTAAQFKARLATAATAWKSTVTTQETLKAKLAKLTGTEL
jgi:hypothetical protein